MNSASPHSSPDSSPGTVSIQPTEVFDLIREVLCSNGATDGEARIQAAHLVEADLRGQHSHGLLRLGVLVGRIRNDVLRCDVEPVLRWPTESVVQIDGQAGFGPVTAYAAVSAVTERAESSGIAAALIRNTNHLGMLAPYVEKIAGAGQIGIVATTSEALVHPWGGAKPMLGTNPIAIGIPTASKPLSLDMSTASVSMGKILAFAARDEPIPLGWAVDARGAPTTDAAQAQAGALSPFGGAKGYALGLALELMIATLTGTAMGDDVHGTLDEIEECNKGDLIICISPRRLDLPNFAERAQAYLDAIRHGPRADPGARIYVPGDRAHEIRSTRETEGIPLDRPTWQTALRLRDVAAGRAASRVS